MNISLQPGHYSHFGDGRKARSFLHEALQIGYKYGCIRAFLVKEPSTHLQQYSNELLRLVNQEALKEINGNPKMKETLTLREIEIIKYIQKGFSNQAIGTQLNIKEGTVKGHLNRIFKKLNVKNRVQAVKTAENQLLL